MTSTKGVLVPAAAIIVTKLKPGDSAVALGREVDRRAHAYKNDVHLEFSERNEYIEVRPGDATAEGRAMPLEQAIERRLGELNTKRKIRKDSAKAMGFVVSTNSFLEGDQARAFLRQAADWIGARYGRENLLSASIHMDEGTPHAHVWICPVMHDEKNGYDTLAASKMFTPDTLSELQKDFYEQVAKPWGFDEPVKSEKRAEGKKPAYTSIEEYKARQALEQAEKAAELAEKRLECLQKEEAKLELEVADLQPNAEGFTTSASYVHEHQADPARERALAAENRQLRGRLGEVEQQVEQARQEKERLGRDVRELGKKHRRLSSRAGRLARAIAQVRGRIAVVMAKLRANRRPLPGVRGFARMARGRQEFLLARKYAPRLAEPVTHSRQAARMR